MGGKELRMLVIIFNWLHRNLHLITVTIIQYYFRNIQSVQKLCERIAKRSNVDIKHILTYKATARQIMESAYSSYILQFAQLVSRLSLKVYIFYILHLQRLQGL